MHLETKLNSLSGFSTVWGEFVVSGCIILWKGSLNSFLISVASIKLGLNKSYFSFTFDLGFLRTLEIDLLSPST